jgi:membrane-bound metal-dependent hydrolase YbcI (DUF457 family)
VVIPSGKVHIGFAFIVWLFIAVVDTEYANPHWFNPIPFLLGSIFADCDHRHAPMGRILPLWIFFKHRGFTHTIGGLLLFSLLVFDFNVHWGLPFFMGYLLHLLMDSTTPMGIKWIRGHRKKAIRR